MVVKTSGNLHEVLTAQRESARLDTDRPSLLGDLDQTKHDDARVRTTTCRRCTFQLKGLSKIKAMLVHIGHLVSRSAEHSDGGVSVAPSCRPSPTRTRQTTDVLTVRSNSDKASRFGQNSRPATTVSSTRPNMPTLKSPASRRLREL
jgi:hypothetical protein